jgi:hypothetical protein
MTNTTFLVLAYAGLWLAHVFYLWNLTSRQSKMRDEIAQLEERLSQRDKS